MGRSRPTQLSSDARPWGSYCTPNSTAAQVAKDLGISDKTLGNWVRADRQGHARAAEPGAINEAERDELRRLRREVHELHTEREILRKAAAYFASVPR